jgi:DnaJ-class molecular chaperone
VKNYYEVLRVHHDASQEEIKRAYWDVARIKHPDVGGNLDEFVEIVEAHNVLVHPQQRKRYDGKLTLTMDICHVCKGAGAKYHPRTNVPTICKTCRGVGYTERSKDVERNKNARTSARKK